MRYIGRFFIVLYVPECPVGTLGRLPVTVNGAAKRRSALILKGLSCGLLSKILNKLRNYTSLIFLVPFTFLQLLKINGILALKSAFFFGAKIQILQIINYSTVFEFSRLNNH